MKIETALELVEALVYFPGWQISATDHTNRFEGAILVRIDYPATNTNRAHARRGYDECITTHATFPVIVADCDDVALYRKIVNALIKLDTHEIREGLRVKPSYWAPFHPHNIDGMSRWVDTAQRCRDDPLLTDLQFGIG